MSVSTCMLDSSYMHVTIIVINNCVFQLALQQVILTKPTNSCDKKKLQILPFQAIR